MKSYLSVLLLMSLSVFSGCANTQQKAWNQYEQGMLLVFKGYDPSQDKQDQVEKHYLKALEYNPKMPAVNASLATYKAKKGDAQSANAYFEKEVTSHPDAAKAFALVLGKAGEVIKKEEKKAEDKKSEDNKPETEKHE